MSNKQIPEEVKGFPTLQDWDKHFEEWLVNNLQLTSKSNVELIKKHVHHYLINPFVDIMTEKDMQLAAALHPPQQGSADIVYVPVSDTPNVHKDAFWCEEVGEWLKPQPSGEAGAVGVKPIKQIQFKELCVFHSFETWVNKASSWLGGMGRYNVVLCLDKNGNACHIGEDFMAARDNDLFPVTAYRITRTIETTTSSSQSKTKGNE